MRMRSKLLPVLVVAMLGGVCLHAQNAEDQILSSAVSTMAVSGYPGLAVTPDGKMSLTVRDPDGNARKVSVHTADTILRKTSSGYVVVVGFEVPEERDRVIETVQSFGTRGSDYSKSRVGICFTD